MERERGRELRQGMHIEAAGRKALPPGVGRRCGNLTGGNPLTWEAPLQSKRSEGISMLLLSRR